MVHHVRSLHQSGHLVSAPSISMPRLSNLGKAPAIGQVEAGVPQNQVAALFGVSPGTISKLKAKFCETGDVKDRPRSGRPKKTTLLRLLTVACSMNQVGNE